MILNLDVEKRTLGKKSDLNKLRRDGFIPAVVYSSGEKGTPITVPTIEFNKLYKKSIGEIAIFYLKDGNDEVRAIIKEKQIHPVTRKITHIDFLELHPGKEISLDIPINFIGTPAAVKEGAVVDIARRTLNAACLPKYIPEDISLDITNMEVGETIYCKDITLENIRFNENEDLAIVTVSIPRLVEAAADEATEEVAEESAAE
ncbi:MAG TPA: 50S ribosomal protein L25 [Candidatus Cloacimonadota bacterium]|jgi:large subunit ribosomal protein L25|nr:50S ribosomal protein L25 [Candidatus Cloacimonadales bacterium]HPY97007.1 50S ribosomal protein L25 [Candidatus Cloacimonadota bacterium]HQB41595.1 50S ribosomal protein L25 [Candidatus Cloacimonadota bacterium]